MKKALRTLTAAVSLLVFAACAFADPSSPSNKLAARVLGERMNEIAKYDSHWSQSCRQPAQAPPKYRSSPRHRNRIQQAKVQSVRPQVGS